MRRNIIAAVIGIVITLILVAVLLRSCKPEPEIVETVRRDTVTTITIDTVYIPQDRVVYRNLHIPTPAETLYVDTGSEEPRALSYHLTHNDSLVSAEVDIITRGVLLDWSFAYTPNFPTITRTDSVVITNTVTRTLRLRRPIVGLGISAEGEYHQADANIEFRVAPFLAIRLGHAEIGYLPTVALPTGTVSHILRATYSIR